MHKERAIIYYIPTQIDMKLCRFYTLISIQIRYDNLGTFSHTGANTFY